MDGSTVRTGAGRMALGAADAVVRTVLFCDTIFLAKGRIALVKRKNVRDSARNRRDRPKAPSCLGAASDASERTAAEAVLQEAAEPSAIAREAAVSAEAAVAFEPTSRSTSSGSSSAASPSADSAGVLSRPQASVASGPAEPPAVPPVPVYHVHDLAYRGLLAVKAVFLDFLRSFVPADWVRDLDEDSFTQVESTLSSSCWSRCSRRSRRGWRSGCSGT
ncbi:MAG: hypothetical protein BLM47_07485 [Candidatus Reconcilbacillus cellulovorans]|uniref:Uncharacterized protein n=1 Tax=Candidatus Reconcilbacillus cellulovorans TaxID=1906605 RepID=A0A2A6E039_9BACL|nr:MAG: hypothetical protein BLM47_07485 [Candidatus Reconcilbacillus cellulovorans]